jgi:hypothetical protein
MTANHLEHENCDFSRITEAAGDAGREARSRGRLGQKEMAMMPRPVLSGGLRRHATGRRARSADYVLPGNTPVGYSCNMPVRRR